ncbi:hypothetical protein [Saccharopolyspora gregorii]|uniref:hypothetical protein n=1 Tax=Saccharopolyspora gregorii TaxID=33914 RepID=UPI0031E8913E
MPRIDAVAREFLRYLYAEDHFRPEVAAFLHSPHARTLTPPPDHTELAEALDSLRHHQLVATGREHTDGLPHRAGLTGTGLICVSEHDGDLPAWRRTRTTTVLTAPPPPPHVISPRPAAEPTTVPTDSLHGIARVARVCLLALPTVHARYGEHDRVQHTARQLFDATRSPHPDPRRIRSLTTELRTHLSTGTIANTLGVVLLDSLDEAIREAQLP